MSLLGKLKTLTSFTHRNRSEKFDLWKGKLKGSYYSNGIWYINEYVTSYDQSKLYSTNTTYQKQAGIRFYKGSSYQYFAIYYWYPYNRNTNQVATVEYVNPSNHSLDTIVTQQLNSTSQIKIWNDTSLTENWSVDTFKDGTITVTIPTYIDRTNGVYYTGVKYSVSCSGLSTTTKRFNVTYLETDNVSL